MYPDYTVESQEFVFFEMTLLYSSLDHIAIDVSVLRRKLCARSYLESFFALFIYIFYRIVFRQRDDVVVVV